MSMRQTMEYVFSDEVLELLDHFTSLTEVRIAIFSLEGDELCIGKDRDICSFCSMRRREPEFDNACFADDQHGREIALENGGIYFYQCHSGLCEAVMPVKAGGVPIGFAMIGQFRLVDTQLDARSECELKALKKLPAFNHEKIDDLLSMFEVLIHHITNQALVGRRDFDLLNPLLKQLRSDPAKQITLTEAAKMVGLSTSRLSHLFTAIMGINFKRYQITQRLDLADRLMKMHPDWRIAHVAETCGFEDPLYFSRVYKKHRGVPPSRAIDLK